MLICSHVQKNNSNNASKSYKIKKNTIAFYINNI